MVASQPRAAAAEGGRSPGPAGAAGVGTAAPLLLALLLAWPLAALRDSGSLAAVLGLSVLVSAGLLAAWRTWPLWNDVERLDGSLAQHWQALAGRDLAPGAASVWPRW